MCANGSQINYLKTNTLDNQNSISVYPNPASNKLSIVFNEETLVNDIYLIDLSGKVSTKYSHNTRTKQFDLNLDSKSLVSGLYLIKVLTNKGVFFEKIYIDNK